jgi:DNA-binding response OmpR family regulator
VNILFVENHAVFAETVIASFLAEHTVEIVPSVAAALAVVTAGRFDAALVDYDLDDRKGDAFVREARAADPRLVIIGVSSHDSGNSALLSAGADAVCPKLAFSGIAAVLERARRKKLESR